MFFVYLKALRVCFPLGLVQIAPNRYKLSLIFSSTLCMLHLNGHLSSRQHLFWGFGITVLRQARLDLFLPETLLAFCEDAVLDLKN